MIRQGEVLAGKYIIGNLIAKGGMSYVWFAKELATNKIWAVKDINKLSPKYIATANKDGTLTEVEIVKDLNHPFIPRVNDVFEDETSIQIVMEYVKGKSLREVAESNGPISEDFVLEWAKDIAEIFIYLHTRKNPVIYRDLKPGNIILQKDGQIRLLDFGIALLADPNTSIAEGKPIGTRGFASPEHFKGIVDEKSDIFTLGMTMFCLLSGENPAVTEEPLDFSLISHGLTSIIKKATDENPDSRYASMSALLRDLLNYSEQKKRSVKGLFRKYGRK